MTCKEWAKLPREKQIELFEKAKAEAKKQAIKKAATKAEKKN